MHNDLVELGWTEEHWSRIVGVVNEEAQRARAAAQVIPVVGPEDSSAVAFADFRFTVPSPANPLGPPGPPQRLVTDNVPRHTFTTIAAQVQLTSTEVADGQLEAALNKFRRAANIVARLEDAIVFNDRINAGNPAVGIAGVPLVFQVTGGGPSPGTAVELGLLPLDFGAGPVQPIAPRQTLALGLPAPPPVPPTAAQGALVTTAIIDAMGMLENAGHTRPFACALSPYLYQAVYVPNANFVAAKDRILPILNGPLVRSSAITDLPTPYGVVIALGGSPVAIRVASDICIRFLQISDEPRFVFRVSERIGLRITDPTALVVLTA